MSYLQVWPPQFGLMVADDRGLEVELPALRRPQRLAFATWMVLAKAAPVETMGSDGQSLLGAPLDAAATHEKGPV